MKYIIVEHDIFHFSYRLFVRRLVNSRIFKFLFFIFHLFFLFFHTNIWHVKIRMQFIDDAFFFLIFFIKTTSSHCYKPLKSSLVCVIKSGLLLVICIIECSARETVYFLLFTSDPFSYFLVEYRWMTACGYHGLRSIEYSLVIIIPSINRSILYYYY